MNPIHDPSTAIQGIEQVICFSKELKKIKHLTEMNNMKLFKIEKLTERMLYKIDELTERFDQFEQHRLVAHQPPHLPLQHIAERPKASSPIPEPDLGDKRPKRARK